MAALLAHLLHQRNVPRPAQRAIRLAPQDLDEDFFRKNYRIDTGTFQWLCHIIRDDDGISRKQEGERVLQAPLIVSTALRFLASGSFQNIMGDVSGISQTSQSRAVAAVTDALSSRANQFISFARCGRSADIKAKFGRMAGMPGVLGAIDCTHVPIRSPSVDEYAYVNRKGRHTINVQGIVNHDLRFVNIVAR